MKQFLAGIAALLGAALSPAALAVNYFVDAAVGNDAYTGTSATVQSGTPIVGPWRSLGKVNGATLQPGDNVYFRCGQSWRGTLRTASSPDPARPISYSRFGSDCTNANKPRFTTADIVTGWQPWTDNIWVAPAPFPITHVYADGQALRLAQHPNLDYAVQPWARGMYVVDQSPPPPNTTRGLLDQELAAVADRDLVGAGIRIRVADWIINDLVITAFNPVTLELTFNQPTGWAVRRNWGYYLDNKLWMLDAPGEFFYDAADPAGPRIYVWMPDGAAPDTRLEAANDGFAIDASGAANVVIEALRAEKAGVGVALPSSTNVTVRTVDVADSQLRGIVANAATGGTIDACTVQRSVREGILLGSGSNFRVVNNRVFDSGVIGSPKQSRGGISAFGTDDIISGNHVRNSGFHGISYGKRSNIANNLVENSCLVLNDCAGIYTGNAASDLTPHNSFVIANTVVGVVNDRNGRDPAPVQALLSGIYIDYRTSGVYAGRNTVVGADSAVWLAGASGNTIADNVFYDYLTAAIQIKEYSFWRINSPNRILRNQFFSLSDVTPHFLMPVTPDTSLMATFDGNRYSSLYSDDPARLAMAKTSRAVSGVWTTTALDLPQWRALGNDLTSTVYSEFGIEPFAYAPITGINLLANGAFDAGTDGWRTSSAQNDHTLEWSQACPSPGCASLTTGVLSPSGSLISASLPLAAGSTYVVTFSGRAATPTLTVNVVPRRAGPGSFEPFQSRFPVTLQETWRRQQVLFSVPPDLVFGAGDNGARVDFATGPGSTFWLDNVTLQEVTFSQNDPVDDSVLLMNPTNAATSVSCPDSMTRPARCGEYAWFGTGLPVSWPLQLGPRASAILIWTGNPFRDN